MNTQLIKKLNRLRADLNCGEFILADAKDADMAYGISSPGKRAGTDQYKSMVEFRRQMLDLVQEKHLDILLASVSQLSLMEKEGAVLDRSGVTAAVRINDTSDVWVGRGGTYRSLPSRPFASATIPEVQALGKGKGGLKVNLGLYSITFNNHLDRDYESLETFKAFRLEAAKHKFNYFLEVFAPNVECGISKENIPGYVNDQLVRTLAGIPKSNWPQFLKIPYFGPQAMEELVNYEPSLLVGILGGGSGTTYDAFKLLAEAQKYGARVALFGRKIKDAEDPFRFVFYLRQIVKKTISPEEAVKAYHADLKKSKIISIRSLENDMKLTATEISYARK